ncbi:MAG: hypothetical protein ACXWCW_29455, partial [Burkholderiales bacterium]
QVTAQQTLGGAGVDVTLTGTMRFADDVLAHFDCGLALANRHELEVTGDEGSLFVADPWHCRKPGIQLRREGAEDEWIGFEPVDSYRLEAENLSAAIRGEAKLTADLHKVLAGPLKKRLEDEGIDVTPSTPEQFAAHAKSEIEKWTKVVIAAKLEAD